MRCWLGHGPAARGPDPVLVNRMISARFDDLRPDRRRGFELGPIQQVIEAHTLDQVRPALSAITAAVEAGNWVAGWVSYEAGPAFDPALAVRDLDETELSGLPLVWFAVSQSRQPAAEVDSKPYDIRPWQPLTTAEEHHQAVESIRERIRTGDTYQVNYTFPLRSEISGDVASFYDHLIRSQSCGYGALVETPKWIVASASPELFFEWSDDTITCRPMKGTARRGVDLDEDARMSKWLAHSEKNRAENVMIVDMVRNDLGRIARVGSVEVPSLFTTEKYDTLWQLTSTVTAAPRAGTDLDGVFAALFPSASITGAPKVSTMSIISQLESHPRGVYCGAIGFGGPGHNGPEWAFNVGIRTVLIERTTGIAHYGTGDGITYDSEPADEYAEAVLKAQVLNRRGGELQLVETTRWDPGSGGRHMARHIERLTSSAIYFDIPFDPAALDRAVARAVTGLMRPVRLRILVDRRGEISAEVSDLPTSSGPVVVRLDDRPVDRFHPFLHHKTTMRRVYDEAAARHPDAADVLLWNEDGEITETTIGNVAFSVGGAWVTPPVSCGLLAGTERAARLASGEIVERVVRIGDLDRCQKIARLNSVRGWESAVLG